MTTLVTVGSERDYPGHVPNGPVGRRLVERLLASGEAVRVLAVPEEADGWPSSAEVIVGDVARPDETPTAFEGIDRLFLAGAVPETARRLMALTSRTGVPRVVVLSSHGPDVEIEFEPSSWYWLAVEVIVERSTTAWTHLQPAPLMVQTTAPGFPDIGSDLPAAVRAAGPVHEADPDETYPLIAEDDLAAAAAVALSDEAYVGRRLSINGPPISLREQVALVGRALGRRIAVEPLTPAEQHARYRAAGLSVEEIDAWTADPQDPEVADTAAAEGDDWMTAGVETLTRVLGRPPRSYADWLTDHLDRFR